MIVCKATKRLAFASFNETAEPYISCSPLLLFLIRIEGERQNLQLPTGNVPPQRFW